MTMSAVDEFETSIVASKDITYIKTHGHQLLVNNLYVRLTVTAIHTTSIQ